MFPQANAEINRALLYAKLHKLRLIEPAMETTSLEETVPCYFGMQLREFLKLKATWNIQ